MSVRLDVSHILNQNNISQQCERRSRYENPAVLVRQSFNYFQKYKTVPLLSLDYFGFGKYKVSFRLIGNGFILIFK